MSLRSSFQKPEEKEFVHLIINERFYILHLLSDSFFYLHCDLYTYPDDIDHKRYHHKIKMLNSKDDKNFQLILIESNLNLNSTWLLVLQAELWFKLLGIKEFRACLK